MEHLSARQAAAPLAGTPCSTAEALRAGVSRRALEHARFEAVHRGMRWSAGGIVRAGLAATPQGEGAFEDEAWMKRVIACVPLLRPGEAISHSTALRLHGCPITDDGLVHLTIPAPNRGRRLSTVRGHTWPTEFTRIPLDALETMPWLPPGGRLPAIPTVEPAQALLQSAGLLPLVELVVAADAIVGQRRSSNGTVWSLSTRDELSSAAADYTGRGARRLRRALDFSRVGAESRMETLLRLLLEAYGLAGNFELQHEVRDGTGFIGRFDLVCVEWRVILEYDGEQHRTSRTQYLRDIRRLDRARDAGWTVIRAHSIDLFEAGARGRLIARLAQKLGRVQAPALVEAAFLPS